MVTRVPVMLFVITCVALLLITGLAIGLRMWVKGGKPGADSPMGCGKCGYAVKGLSQLTCPECGADLREVGIDRGTDGNTRLIGMVLTLSILAGILLVVLRSLPDWLN